MFDIDCIISFMSFYLRKELEKVYVGLICRLEEIVELVVLDISNFRIRVVFGVLFIFYVYCRDRVRDLLFKNIFSVEDFEWIR